MEKIKEKETPEDAQEKERKTKGESTERWTQKRVKENKKKVRQKCIWLKPCWKGIKKREKEDERMGWYVVPKWDLPIYFGIHF